MDVNRRATLAIGLVLVLFGAFFLAVQFLPGSGLWQNPGRWWPLAVVVWGIALLLLAVVLRVPALSIPACVVGGIGLLLFWQSATGNWDSWAYAWALIPGFVGVGVIATGLLEGKLRSAVGAGLWLIAISVVLFVVFGSLLGGPRLLGAVWPILLIGLGVLILARSVLGRR